MVVFFVKSNENTLPKRESTHENVHSCPSNEEGIIQVKCY